MVHWRTATCVLVFLMWVPREATCERDSNTCIFYYWQVDWRTAVKTCEDDHKRLLCYKSKKEIDDITEAFRLTAVGSAKLSLWLSSRDCASDTQFEECLSLHIQKSGKTVWHYFQDTCDEEYQFVCCINGTAETTTSIEYISSPENLKSEISDTTKPSLSTTTLTSNSEKSIYCKNTFRRGILWLDTDAGKISTRSCPGNSAGEAHWKCEPSGKWEKQGPDLTECRSRQIQSLKDRFNSSSASDVIRELQHIFEDKSKEVFGRDLSDIASLMTALPDRLFSELESVSSPALRWASANSSVSRVMSVVDRLVELDPAWYDIEKKGRSTAGTHLLSTVDGMGSLLACSLPKNLEEQSIMGKNMALQVLKPKLGEPVYLPQWNRANSFSQQGSILLEEGYDTQITEHGGNVSLVFALYTDMSTLLTFARDERKDGISTLNSAVLSATVAQGMKSLKIKNLVRITVEHLTLNPNNSACVFWNMERDYWDTSGCRLESSNRTYSACVCDHLTNFALLMDYRDVLSDVDQRPFHYITVIGCTLSILCLAVCVIIFSCYSYHSRHSWGLRYVIHRNLCLTLLVANLVLVFGLDRTENQKVCSTIAGLLHYFFLSAFSWMLLEGVHIYLLLVVVFASRKSHSEKYYLFGYGFPLIIVAVTAISRPTYYGTDEVCWLSSEKGTIWGFLGPVAVILILNTAALILAQYKASRISVKDDKVALLKRWLRVTFILFPILGITWVFGFLYIGKHFEVMGYLFAFFNSFQGVCIFIFHCLLDKKARGMVLDSFKKRNTSVHTGSSGTQKKKENHRNGVKSNAVTPVEDNVINCSGKQKVFQVARSGHGRREWFKWHKPWSFCFELSVSDKEPKEQDNSPQALIVQWNTLKDKNCM